MQRPGKGILRRADGFIRYAISVQYHGSSFLGFPYQGPTREDCILPDGTDLRGYRSIEGRIREALTDLLGGGEVSEGGDSSDGQPHGTNLLTSSSFENIQVSSRTDRGVHALKNTFHVDILQDEKDKNKDSKRMQVKLRQGLNYYLSRQGTFWDRYRHDTKRQQHQHQKDKDNEKEVLQDIVFSTKKSGWKKKRVRQRKRYQPQQFSSSFTLLGDQEWTRHSIGNELRILNVVQAPDGMRNDQYKDYPGQTPTVDWNARFSATQRTYIYRLLSFASEQDDDHYDHYPEWGMPFEWDRSWRVMRSTNNDLLNVSAMQEAARYLEGTHDFTSFRAANCQRDSPVVTMHNISVQSQPYGEESSLWGNIIGTGGGGTGGGGLLGLRWGTSLQDTTTCTNTRTMALLVTIQVTGDSFLYRQVRNMVGCLVEVGRGKLHPHDVHDMLQAKDRSVSPPTAPPHGLFLVDVQHGDFRI